MISRLAFHVIFHRFLLFKCCFVAWQRGLPQTFASCFVPINSILLNLWCVWILFQNANTCSSYSCCRFLLFFLIAEVKYCCPAAMVVEIGNVLLPHNFSSDCFLFWNSCFSVHWVRLLKIPFCKRFDVLICKQCSWSWKLRWENASMWLSCHCAVNHRQVRVLVAQALSIHVLCTPNCDDPVFNLDSISPEVGCHASWYSWSVGDCHTRNGMGKPFALFVGNLNACSVCTWLFSYLRFKELQRNLAVQRQLLTSTYSPKQFCQI